MKIEDLQELVDRINEWQAYNPNTKALFSVALVDDGFRVDSVALCVTSYKETKISKLKQQSYDFIVGGEDGLDINPDLEFIR